ncbi:SBBP repeat-containing protein [Pontibacter sp. HSC-14F20]|uniref:SBBP repeat-containing protein n=1 Tax=Pontibacter sp. HSC-14F20 TaxID=2864136 RepID=UPI001C730CDA|nr:SBBP repeat-containing protein [Pontibacter sp. HSC-14F20]MBX0332432.1 SBBP repeat-containing protein [Pontibacter sp. HSC-14F20]
MEQLLIFGRALVLAVLLIIPTFGYTQASQEWVATYNGPEDSRDGATAMVVDATGNVYVTGFSYASRPVNDSEASKDIATIKYNSAGEQLWVARFNGSVNGADHAVDIGLDAAGNVYVTGYSADSETADSDPRSRYDYVTIKYNATGDEQWVAYYNGPGNGWDQATALEVDAAGNVYVTGSVYVDGPGFGGSANYDYATIKYSTDGDVQWIKRYNRPSGLADRATSLALDASGNVYVTGTSLDIADIFRSSAATIKYDAVGNEVWIVRYSGPENMSSVYASDLALDVAGNVYITGYSWSELDSDDLPMYDYTTLKYSSAGVLQWDRFFDSGELAVYQPASRDDFARALAVDDEGNVYVTGQTGNREEDPDNAFLTIKYSTLGDVLWSAPFDGPGGPQGGGGNDIALDAEGNVYVTGSITMTQKWQNTDYATIKYSPEGVQQWLMTYNGPGDYIDNAVAIGLDAAGNVYVTGQSYLDDESVYYTDMDSEYATIKYSQVTTEDVSCSNGKLLICHNGRLLCLPPTAVQAHLRNHKGDRLGRCTSVPLEKQTVSIPLRVYPNPFQDFAQVEFALFKKGEYRLELYSASGKMLGVVAKGYSAAGKLVSKQLQAGKLYQGIYYLKLITPDEVQTVRLVLK